MNKAELVSEIAIAVGVSKLEADRILKTIISAITNNLAHGEIIKLAGFGTFFVGKREARTGRNPRTGATIKIRATNSPKFRASKGLMTVPLIKHQEPPPVFSRKVFTRDSATGVFSQSYRNEALSVKDRSKKKTKNRDGSDNTGPNIKVKK